MRLRDAGHQWSYDEQREHCGLNRERNSQRLPAPTKVACLRGWIAIDQASDEDCFCRRVFWFSISITLALHGRTSFWRAPNRAEAPIPGGTPSKTGCRLHTGSEVRALVQLDTRAVPKFPHAPE